MELSIENKGVIIVRNKIAQVFIKRYPKNIENR